MIDYNDPRLKRALIAVVVTLALAILWLLIFAPALASGREAEPFDVQLEGAEQTSGWCELDGWCPPEYVEGPQTAEVDFPRAEHLRTIGRLSDGIWEYYTKRGELPFWTCGEPLRGDQARDKILEVAYNVVRAAHEAGDERHQLNVWGWAGTISTESRFDICALGTNPRKLAYRLHVLKPRRLTVSHTKADIVRAINDPRMEARCRSYDLGMAQTLDTHYRKWLRRNHQQGNKADLLEYRGLNWQAVYMHSLAVTYDTDRPWRYWPGRPSDDKDAKVTRHARRLGATREEI